uniref:Uncharacterized protein n=1 Tax=Ditylenchus dipsaci TaxID=166011 RepID=A0A915EPZ1_9BILA
MSSPRCLNNFPDAVQSTFDGALPMGIPERDTKLLKDGPGLDESALVAWLHSHPRVEEPKVLKMECCNWPINCQSIWERLTEVFTSSESTRAFYCLQVQTSRNIGGTPVATKLFKDALGGLKHTKEEADEELVLLANDYFANETNDGDLNVSMLVCRSRPGDPMAALLQQMDILYELLKHFFMPFENRSLKMLNKEIIIMLYNHG